MALWWFLSHPTCHRLQPLDVILCGPLKSEFHRECDLIMKTRSMTMSPFDMASVFNKVYSQVASVEKISGFKVTGIYLLNPHTFSAESFVVPAVLFLLQRSQISLTNNQRHWATATDACWLQVNYSVGGTQKFLVLILHTAVPDF